MQFLLAFRAVGGYNELVRKYVADEASGNASTCGVLPGYSMYISPNFVYVANSYMQIIVQKHFTNFGNM